jgi:SAM-dependent methyltransferase
VTEFTGERAIPGEIDVDLLNEHVARYLFAARLARGKRVLDAGCGAGYGSAELARAAQSVVGLDLAAAAVGFASAHYRFPNLFFEQGSCVALPHPAGAFDLVVAFEVIEHLEDWREFLLEARRVLAPSGQFMVSTPNKLYYAESRGEAGANPFHAHEFEFEELKEELNRVFPHVSMFLENHVEGLAFQPDTPDSAVEVRVDAGQSAPEEANFFVAVCADRTQLGHPTFVYVPAAANVLRERERHIAKLERELAAKNEWLADSERQRAELLEAHRRLTEELERSNEWTKSELARIEAELARSNRWAEERDAEYRRAEEELQRSNQWAAELDREVKERRAMIVALQEEVAREQASAQTMAGGYRAKVAEIEEELARRAAWAKGLDEQLEKIRSSRWYKFGKTTGMGPSV